MKWVRLILILLFILLPIGCQKEPIVTPTLPVATLPPTTPPTSTLEQPSPTFPSSINSTEVRDTAFAALNRILENKGLQPLRDNSDLTALAEKRCRDVEGYSRGVVRYLGWDSELLSKVSSFGMLGGSLRALEASECYDVDSVTNKLMEWCLGPYPDYAPYPVSGSEVGLGYCKGYLCLLFKWAW